MGAFIVAGIVAVLTVIFAFISELARGMAPAPSMIASNFWPILITGWVIAALIAATHVFSFIGW